MIPIMTLNLPTEIWFRIAYFIPDKDLYHLSTVNHLFHALATDRRYRFLVIDDDNPQALLHKIGRIECVPIISFPAQAYAAFHSKNGTRSSSTRTLSGHLSQRHTLCLSPHRKDDFVRKESILARKSLVRISQAISSNFRWERSRSHKIRYPNKEDLVLADRLLNAFSKLTNVHSYTIEWKQVIETGRNFCLPFLAAVWSLLLHSNISLYRLTLDVSFSHLSDVLSLIPSTATRITFAHLTSLSLHLTSTGFSFVSPPLNTGYTSYTEQTLSQLASFLNLISPSLRSLSLSSLGHLDFSFVFIPLQTFPHLRELSLSISCDPRHLTNPRGFTAFLEAHKHQLEVLSFSPQYCCLHSSVPHSQTQLSIIPLPSSTSNIFHGKKPADVVWGHQTFSQLNFPALRTLELGLNILGPGGKRVLPCILHIALAVARGQLDLERYPVESTMPLILTIMGKIISLDDLDDLIAPFSVCQETLKHNLPTTRASSRRLNELIIEVHVLSVRLLDLLSIRLPYLERLVLAYRWVGESGCSNTVSIFLLLL